MCNWMKTRDLAHPTLGLLTNQEPTPMQTIHVPNLYLSAPRLLLKNASTAGAIPSETLTTRLSPKMSRLTPSSLMRRIGTRWLWRRQSQISCKWIDATQSAGWRFVQLVRQNDED